MFAPVERELVFDIDLTDYDDVRTCGKEAHICSACWPLMAVAVQVCSTALAFRVCPMQTRRVMLTGILSTLLVPQEFMSALCFLCAAILQLLWLS